MKKEKLTVGERINLGNLLPTKHDFITLKIIRDLQDQLSFTEDEIKKCNIRSEIDNGRPVTRWDDAKYSKEFQFGEVLNDIIVKQLKKLDEMKALPIDHMTLYEKFILDKTTK